MNTMNATVFGFDKPEDSPGFLLWQTTTIWQRLIKKALDPYDISHAQFVILAISLWFQDKNTEIPQAWIVQYSQLDKMTVSKSIKKLTTQGYLKRIENNLDTRAKSIFLTNKGKALITQLVPLVEKIDQDFFNAIGKNEQKSLIKFLNTINARCIESLR